MTDITVRGAEELERLAKNLKSAGESGKGFRKELLAGIRKANEPVVADIRESARDILPSGGGFADLIAGSKIGARTRLTGKNAGVQIKALNPYQIKRLNSGRLRHPLFGNRRHWFTQSVEPGWFDRPIEKALPQIRSDIEAAMRTAARQIERGV